MGNSFVGTAIAGNGCAAVECFKAMREQGYGGEIHVFAPAGLPVYNPMLTSYYAAGKIAYSAMFPYGDNLDIFDRYGVILHQASPVTALSAAKKTLTTAAGTYTFDNCLIASGASAFVPPFPGSDSERVYTMRTAEDAVRLKAALEKKPKKALVVGASMVGIKLVELFYNAGVETVLADMAPHIFPLGAHPDCARIIEKRLTEHGISLMFNAAIERAEDTPDGIRAFFKGIPEPVDADVLLVCIGVRANLNFIDRAEIPAEQGVLVNGRMESGAPGIYAAGDAAQGVNLLSGKRQVIGLWANARIQGMTAGCNMAGGFREHQGELPHNITHFLGMDFIGIGEVRDYTDMEVWESRDQLAMLFYKDGILCGANLLDSKENCGVIKSLITKRLLHPQGAKPQSFQEYLLKELRAGLGG